MDQPQIYNFVGGKRDGNVFPVPGHVQVGTIIRFQLVADPSKAELYQMGNDGQFHFVTYAWMDSDSPRTPAEMAAAAIPAEHMQSLLHRLGAVINDLNEAFVARGEFPRGIQVNGWVLQRKEAIAPPPEQEQARSRRIREARPRKKKRPPGE